MVNLDIEFYKTFIQIIEEKVPGRGKLCNILVDILFIEKEAVYRRLRGDVPFSFAEIVKISRHLNISLDKIIGVTSPYRSLPFFLHNQDYFNMCEIDYRMSLDYITAIKAAANSPYSEFGFAKNVLPLHTSVFHPPIFRFYLLKWMYQFGNPGEVLPYSQILIPEKLKEYHRQYIQEAPNIKYTYFICNEHSLLHLIRDVQYFRSIRLLTDEEVALIKEEIYHFLNDLEKIAIVGTYDTGNKVEIFVSDLNFETSYSYLMSNNIYVSMIDAFTLGSVTSVDQEACEKMRTWMQALKRTSMLISGAEKNRVLFFEKQRGMLEKM
jgi:hypothetical protein